jgi:hypothetical protein
MTEKYANVAVTPTLTPRQAQNFWRRVLASQPNDCWRWTGEKSQTGYGRHVISRRGYYAHRVAWELQNGPVPRGLVLDHLCGNTLCVNARHLEPVTQRENVLRGRSPVAKHATATHCAQGHEYTTENTRVRRGRRECRVCIKTWDATSWKRANQPRRKAREQPSPKGHRRRTRKIFHQPSSERGRRQRPTRRTDRRVDAARLRLPGSNPATAWHQGQLQRRLPLPALPCRGFVVRAPAAPCSSRRDSGLGGCVSRTDPFAGLAGEGRGVYAGRSTVGTLWSNRHCRPFWEAWADYGEDGAGHPRDRQALTGAWHARQRL